MPATTTVRVHAETRDQLRSLAERAHTTMPAVIAELAQAELDRRMLAETFAAMDAMTPEERAGYDAELTAWDTTLMDGLKDEMSHPPHDRSRGR